MKGRFLKKTIAVCLTLLLVSGSVTIKPISQILDDAVKKPALQDILIIQISL